MRPAAAPDAAGHDGSGATDDPGDDDTDPAQTASPAPASAAIGAGAPSGMTFDARADAPVDPAPASPAGQQVAQRMQTMAQTLGNQGLAGHAASAVTITLNPGSLGEVRLHIGRAADGTASVTLQVEKAETLQALQQDTAHLHQALDRAGLPEQGRHLSLSLTPVDAPQTGQNAAGTGFGGAGPGDSNQGGANLGQGAGSGGQRFQAPGRAGASEAADNVTTPRAATSPIAGARATGINITA
jgi:hypothetical protein